MESNFKDPLYPDSEIVEDISSSFESSVKGYVWKCSKCGANDEISEDPKLCKLCFIEQKNKTALAKNTNADWMELAKTLGLEVFERQPEEGDIEWRIWEKYRSYYPLKLPTYSELAAATGHAVATVVKAAQKWSYKIRLLEWARYTDADIQTQRVAAIREMNQKQLGISKTMVDKLRTAVNNIDPLTLRPNEIINLFKVSVEMERKITEYVEPTVVQSAIADKSAPAQGLTKVEDIDEIVEILKRAGALQGKNIGIETTTRVVLAEEKHV